MKQKLFACLTAAFLMTGLLTVQAAAAVPVQVDGETLPLRGRLEEGVTYVALRELLDAFGGWELRWDKSREAAVATTETETLVAPVGEARLIQNGQTIDLPGNSYCYQGRTYVPLRAVAEAFGAQVEWDPYLRGAAVTSPDFELSVSAADFYWLTRAISAESRGEGLQGQVAVGNVILNRVADKEFPDSISAVVFDRKNGVQFEPISNGTIYDDPTPQSVRAAILALGGERPVGDSLYFFAPALSKGRWISANRPYLTTIGCHRFYL